MVIKKVFPPINLGNNWDTKHVPYRVYCTVVCVLSTGIFSSWCMTLGQHQESQCPCIKYLTKSPGDGRSQAFRKQIFKHEQCTPAIKWPIKVIRQGYWSLNPMFYEAWTCYRDDGHKQILIGTRKPLKMCFCGLRSTLLSLDLQDCHTRPSFVSVFMYDSQIMFGDNGFNVCKLF